MHFLIIKEVKSSKVIEAYLSIAEHEVVLLVSYEGPAAVGNVCLACDSAGVLILAPSTVSSSPPAGAGQAQENQ